MTSGVPWIVYMIESLSGKIYTGISTDPDRRFEEHLFEKTGAKFFRGDPPSSIVFREVYGNRSEASKREYSIKKMPRKKKLLLIEKLKNKGKS